jgi:hypothetical protein
MHLTNVFTCVTLLGHVFAVLERVLFIGTQFSILYTSMYSPAEAATSNIAKNYLFGFIC